MRAKRARQQPVTVDYQGLAQLRYLLRQFAVFSESAARRAGLTAQQHQALLAVLGFPGTGRVTVGALAERLGLRPHSAVGLVDRLVARQFLRRSHGARDRRQVWVDVTPRARGLLRRLSRVHRDELRRVAPLLRALLRRLGTRPGPRRRPRPS
ncbi:MAG TPA: MarR family transcriptional regulator [Steroidobacteraceae bacterium]|jgi:DNA-binding MarR family transcriptional regulator